MHEIQRRNLNVADVVEKIARCITQYHRDIRDYQCRNALFTAEGHEQRKASKAPGKCECDDDIYKRVHKGMGKRQRGEQIAVIYPVVYVVIRTRCNGWNDGGCNSKAKKQRYGHGCTAGQKCGQ